MQYNNGASEESLLAADSVKLHITRKEAAWHNCRVIKRDNKLLAITTQGKTSANEIEIPGNATVDASVDGKIIVAFTIAEN